MHNIIVKDVEVIPVMQVTEFYWLDVYNQAIAERKFALAQQILDWFMPFQ